MSTTGPGSQNEGASGSALEAYVTLTAGSPALFPTIF